MKCLIEVDQLYTASSKGKKNGKILKTSAEQGDQRNYQSGKSDLYYKKIKKTHYTIKIDHGVHVSNEIVRKVLRDNNIDGRVARKKPLISKTKKGKRLDFGKTFESKPDEF